MKIKAITPAEVVRLQEESGSVVIIDVREVDEFAEVFSPLAVNFPLSTFAMDAICKRYDRNERLFMLCRSGRRSEKAAYLIASQGFTSIFNIEGGMSAWEAAGLPVIRPKGRV